MVFLCERQQIRQTCTDHLYQINLPVGLVTVLSIVFLIPASPAPPLDDSIVEGVKKRWSFLTRGKYCPKEGSILFKLASLDFVGAVLMLAITTSLVMVLQWGGVTYCELLFQTSAVAE